MPSQDDPSFRRNPSRESPPRQPPPREPGPRAGKPAPGAAGSAAPPEDEPTAAEAADPGQVFAIDDAADLPGSTMRDLQTELDQAIEGRKRALADFRNFQRRASENEQRALQSGAVRVVRAILPALDHFDLALTQNIDQMTVDQLLTAVSIVRDELAKALASQGVERIAPARGEPFDPNRHEAVMREPAADVAPGGVVGTMQAGFSMGDQVLRPAKVSVAPETEEG